MLRDILLKQITNPSIPDGVKIQFQNLAGCAYGIQGILNITMTASATNTLSPLASLDFGNQFPNLPLDLLDRTSPVRPFQ